MKHKSTILNLGVTSKKSKSGGNEPKWHDLKLNKDYMNYLTLWGLHQSNLNTLGCVVMLVELYYVVGYECRKHS